MTGRLRFSTRIDEANGKSNNNNSSNIQGDSGESDSVRKFVLKTRLVQSEPNSVRFIIKFERVALTSVQITNPGSQHTRVRGNSDFVVFRPSFPGLIRAQNFSSKVLRKTKSFRHHYPPNTGHEIMTAVNDVPEKFIEYRE